MLGKAAELMASIILTQHFSSVAQLQKDFNVDEMESEAKEDAFMSFFFANVYRCLLQQWEHFVKQQSAKFRQ